MIDPISDKKPIHPSLTGNPLTVSHAMRLLTRKPDWRTEVYLGTDVDLPEAHSSEFPAIGLAL
jgi:hypothetical protein